MLVSARDTPDTRTTAQMPSPDTTVETATAASAASPTVRRAVQRGAAPQRGEDRGEAGGEGVCACPRQLEAEWCAAPGPVPGHDGDDEIDGRGEVEPGHEDQVGHEGGQSLLQRDVHDEQLAGE